ncbi:MAG TPA: type II secretion system F family protein [Acidimicrobiales bacterium]|jgi:tight adherence protein B|nr:type II secretion system F family protein [Acidimicrobiales bacterium]
MSGSEVLAAVMVGLGLALVGIGVLSRFRARTESLADILDLPYGERDVAVEPVSETRSPLVTDTIELAGRMVDQFDTRGSLQTMLERARIPMRSAEFVVVVGCMALVGALVLSAVTEQWLFGLGILLTSPLVGKAYLSRRIDKRRKAFEEQLPEALSVIASSLSAGHTFLRSIQMMCEESQPPLSDEFQRVVAETRLGGSVVDALDRMARRLDIKDLIWVVQAIRIQQQVGGKLADLLHTLADFIRAREDIRREVDVLTAEGRISAWVLTALPVFIMLAVQVTNPDYLQPFYQGWGILVLVLTTISMLSGFFIIRRMVNIEV